MKCRWFIILILIYLIDYSAYIYALKKYHFDDLVPVRGWNWISIIYLLSLILWSENIKEKTIIHCQVHNLMWGIFYGTGLIILLNNYSIIQNTYWLIGTFYSANICFFIVLYRTCLKHKKWDA